MIMVCQGRNIPLLFSSIEPLFPTKSLCVAIFLCLSTLPTCAEAGEYFNPNLLEVTANSATSVDLSYFSQDGVPPPIRSCSRQEKPVLSCRRSRA